jgi:hypothetical protein
VGKEVRTLALEDSFCVHRTDSFSRTHSSQRLAVGHVQPARACWAPGSLANRSESSPRGRPIGQTRAKARGAIRPSRPRPPFIPTHQHRRARLTTTAFRHPSSSSHARTHRTANTFVQRDDGLCTLLHASARRVCLLIVGCVQIPDEWLPAHSIEVCNCSNPKYGPPTSDPAQLARLSYRSLLQELWSSSSLCRTSCSGAV